jgi:GNAT superfamily N-acetyltransferase
MTRIRPMTAADLSLGLHLSRQAGWNQTDADWRRALELQPDGCFVAEWEGAAVGTTTVCVFGDVAWIALVLVDEAARGHGVGTALVQHALNWLDEHGVPAVRLDATPLGQPLYERLGFVAQNRLARYEGTLPAVGDDGPCEAARPEQWETLAALDEAVTATDRRKLLFRLFAEQPGAVRVAGADGFLAARPGRRAVQIGPCIAAPDAGPVLFADAWRCYAGRHVYVDIPIANEAATRRADARGLTVQRTLTRMVRGTPRCERLEWLWASSGPEKG